MLNCTQECALAYEKLPIDMSGAVSKCRFKNEVLWGLKQIYDLDLNGEDFIVIFDNRCDIEIFTKGKISFYQLKTKNQKNKFSFTPKSLVKIEKGKKDSIISKLCSLYDENITEGLYIVSNVNLSISGSEYAGAEIIRFDNLSDFERNIIQEHLKIQNMDVDLSKIYFWNSEFCIDNPDTLLIGHTALYLREKFGCETMQPIYLFKYLSNEIEKRASYEKTNVKLEDAIKNKGFSKSQLTKILNAYSAQNTKIEEKFRCVLDNEFENISDRLNIFKSYKLLCGEDCEALLKEALKTISEFVRLNPEVVQSTDKEFIETVKNSVCFDNIFSEYDKISVTILYLVKCLEVGEIE